MILWNNMEKRLVIAIALSLLVLLGWSVLMPKPQTIVPQAVTSKNVVVPAPSLNTDLAINQENTLVPEKPVHFENEILTATFNESSASLKEVIFKKYKNYAFQLNQGFYLSNETLVFKKDKITSNSVSFLANDTNRKIIKEFRFHKSNYSMELETKIINQSAVPIQSSQVLILGLLDLSGKNLQARYLDVTLSNPDKTIHVSAAKNTSISAIKFIGFRDQYFTAIINSDLANTTGFVSKDKNQGSSVGINVQTETILPQSQTGHLYHIYLGPQDVNMLNSINPSWAAVIHYGTFDFISQILLQTLGLLFKLVHNWGVAIILLSILVYLVLYPLSIKQMRSMKEMQILQPKVEELRKAYKDNPQKMNKEIMELYREHKVNPLGGCLPLLLQMPIFFALYNALIRSIVLKGAKFLWIKDLSEPDRLIVLPKALPILGSDINILPIIMAMGMFIQQKISMASNNNSAAAEQQKIMLIVMPIMFGFIFYRMPSGLVLYWFVNSVLMLVFQLRMNRKK
jgi:YidC/Oxa1 family membrane protein insertase